MQIEAWYPTPEPSARRPAGVWVIAGVYGLLYGVLALGLLLRLPEYVQMIARLSALDHVLLWLNTGFDLAGVTCLFILRRPAVPLLGAALGVSVVSGVSMFVGAARGSGATAPDLMAVVVGLSLPVAAWWYARRLRQRGVLQ